MSAADSSTVAAIFFWMELPSWKGCNNGDKIMVGRRATGWPAVRSMNELKSQFLVVVHSPVVVQRQVLQSRQCVTAWMGQLMVVMG